MAQLMMNFHESKDFFTKDPEARYFRPPAYPKYSPKASYREKQWKPSGKESRTFYPIPKGDTPYALAKKAEYLEKDLAKAESFYKQAILEGDRPESAIKDLAGVIHQQGKTLEAIQILKQHKHLFYADITKYDNLLQNLKRQVVQKGNRLNKFLKISPLPLDSTPESVHALFDNSKRISDIELYNEGPHIYAIMKFSTHSAARKTLEGFSGWEKYKIEWISITGDNAGNANHKRGEAKKDRVLFVYKVFHRDPESRAMVLPLDSDPVQAEVELKFNECMKLIGKELCSVLDDPSEDF